MESQPTSERQSTLLIFCSKLRQRVERTLLGKVISAHDKLCPNQKTPYHMARSILMCIHRFPWGESPLLPRFLIQEQKDGELPLCLIVLPMTQPTLCANETSTLEMIMPL